MSSNNQEQFQKYYQTGVRALENGKYRLSITQLESAKQLVAFSSKLGAEVQMLLVTAYQAAGEKKQAIALCQELITHPNLSIQQKAKDVLYIIQAPQLERPPEWMIEIPDLSDGESQKVQYVTNKKTKPLKKVSDELPSVDLSQVNTEDNQFVWFALVLAAITIASLIWLT